MSTRTSSTGAASAITLYTLLADLQTIDPHFPSLDSAIHTFLELAQRMIWRGDPIVLTEQTGVDFHREAYRRSTAALRGAAAIRR